MNRIKRMGVSFVVALSLFVATSNSAHISPTVEAKNIASTVVNQKTKFKLSSVPKFKKSRPYVVVNGNKPYFKKGMMTTKNFEKYSALDRLGRCGVTAACLDEKNMSTGARGSISAIKPTGYRTYRYKGISGGYLYNRSHLIGYQLSAENANRCNLITGTRYMNVDGMLPFENMVADYIEETGNHVLYRVTPIFKGNELVARGVLMEAKSIEDGGEGIEFNVYCYNNQPGITINYKTGTSSGKGKVAASTSKKSSGSSTTKKSNTQAGSYVYSANSNKFHVKGCRYVKQITSANYRTAKSKKALTGQGYEPCKVCRP